MGLIFSRRRRLSRSTSANVSKSGLSVSKRLGRVSVSSRGGLNVRLGKGLRWKL